MFAWCGCIHVNLSAHSISQLTLINTTVNLPHCGGRLCFYVASVMVLINRFLFNIINGFHSLLIHALTLKWTIIDCAYVK